MSLSPSSKSSKSSQSLSSPSQTPETFSQPTKGFHPPRRGTATFIIVDDSKRLKQGQATRFWCKHAGRILTALLNHTISQPSEVVRALEFFERAIVPFLGPVRAPGSGPIVNPHFKSCLTTDGIPLQFSWEWPGKFNHEPPVLRYIIEPTGNLEEATPALTKRKAALDFYNHLMVATRSRPKIADKCWWLQHFNSHFTTNRSGIGNGVSMWHENHSQVLYSFQPMAWNSPIVKTITVTFFPRGTGIKSIEDVKQALETAPGTTAANLAAFERFSHYATNPSYGLVAPLDIEMFSFDLHARPSEARITIFARSKHTDFTSVLRNITLDGTLAYPAGGIENLRVFWNHVLHVKNLVHESLPHSSACTAGVLYAYSFALGDRDVEVKTFIPTEHYGWCDQKVADGTAAYLALEERSKFVAAYYKVLSELFPPRALEYGKRVQPYIGCSIDSDGSLKLVSYINPLFEDMAEMCSS